MIQLSVQLASIELLPLAQKSLLSDLIQAEDFDACFTVEDVAQLLALSAAPEPIVQLLRDLIPLAQTYSLTPISQFQVGAVVQAASGAIYLGANLEFDDYHG